MAPDRRACRIYLRHIDVTGPVVRPGTQFPTDAVPAELYSSSGCCDFDPAARHARTVCNHGTSTQISRGQCCTHNSPCLFRPDTIAALGLPICNHARVPRLLAAGAGQSEGNPDRKSIRNSNPVFLERLAEAKLDLCS